MDATDYHELAEFVADKQEEYDQLYSSQASSSAKRTKNAVFMNSYEFALCSAIESYRENDFEGALEELSRAVDIDSTQYLAYKLRGIIRVQVHEHEEGMKDLSRAIELCPTQWRYSALQKRGLAYELMDKYDLAVQDYRSALEVFPSFVTDHDSDESDQVNTRAYNLARLLCYRAYAEMRLGEFEKALEDGKKAIQVLSDPTSHLFTKVDGSEASSASCNHSSQQQQQQAPALIPAFPYSHLAMVYICMKKFDDAVQACNTGFTIDPNAFDLHEQKGIALYHLGQYEKSIEELTTAIRQGINSSGQSLYFRALAHISLGHKDQGLEDMKKATEALGSRLDNMVHFFCKLGFKLPDAESVLKQ